MDFTAILEEFQAEEKRIERLKTFIIATGYWRKYSIIKCSLFCKIKSSNISNLFVRHRTSCQNQFLFGYKWKDNPTGERKQRKPTEAI